MTGTWKENVSTYHKDCKRKKQTRKHTLKDKVKPLIKKFVYKDIDTKSIYTEGEIYTIPRIKSKQSTLVETWKIQVQRKTNNIEYSFDCSYNYNRYSDKIRIGYYIENKGWFDEYSHEPIHGEVTKLSFLWEEQVDYNLVPSKSYRTYTNYDTIYVYGKPLPEDWHNIYGFWSTRARKSAQKKANRTGRAKVREWIYNANWDKPIKNYALEKSIAWEVW